MSYQFILILILILSCLSICWCKSTNSPLKCHQCISRKGNNKPCELGEDSQIKVCPASKSSYCISLRSFSSPNRELILLRSCSEDRSDVCGRFEVSKREVIEGCPLVCQEDGCNGGEPETSPASSPSGFERMTVHRSTSSLQQYTPYASNNWSQQQGSQTQYPNQFGQYGQSTGQHGTQYGGQYGSQYGSQYGTQQRPHGTSMGGYGQTSLGGNTGLGNTGLGNTGLGNTGYSGSHYGGSSGSGSGSGSNSANDNYYGYNEAPSIKRSPNYIEVGKLILLLLMIRNQDQIGIQAG